MTQLKSLNKSECNKVTIDKDGGQCIAESQGVVQPPGPRNGGAPSLLQSLWGKG